MTPITDELLWEYVDGTISASSRKMVERLIKTDAALAGRLDTVRQLHAGLMDSVRPMQLDILSAAAIKRNVLDSLDLEDAPISPVTQQRKIDWVPAGIGLFLAAVLLASLFACFFGRELIMPEVMAAGDWLMMACAFVIVAGCLFIERFLHYKRLVHRLPFDEG